MQQGAIDLAGYRGRGLERLFWKESFRGILQQGAIDLVGYRSRGLEEAVLERKLSRDIAAGGYRFSGL